MDCQNELIAQYNEENPIPFEAMAEYAARPPLPVVRVVQMEGAPPDQDAKPTRRRGWKFWG